MEFKKACTPSSWPRTMNCPGWVRCWSEQGFPKTEAGEHADRGTRIHALARRMLEGEDVANDATDQRDELDEAIEYYKFTQKAKSQFLANRKLVMEFIEKRVMIPTGKDIHTGSLDWGLVGENTDGTLSVMCADLKTGQNPVSPDTAQGIAYQRGMIDAVLAADCDSDFKLGLSKAKVRDVFFFIFQGGEAKRSKLTFEEFEERYDSVCGTLHDARAMFDGTMDAELVLGDHCRYCPAIQGCPRHAREFEAIEVLQETALSVLSEVEKPEAFSDSKTQKKQDLIKVATAKALATLTTEEKVRIFRVSGAVTKFLDAIKDDLTRIAKDGEGDGLVKLVKGPGRRVISDTQGFIKAVKDVGESPFKAPELINLGDADKILGKEEMDKYTKNTEGNLVLALAEDKRPAANELSFDAIEVESSPVEAGEDIGL